jgi:FkbH-like protein
MNFLEAKKILEQFAGGPQLRIRFSMSGTAEPLTLYLRAAAAARGRDASLNFLPFNTLTQSILSESRAVDGEPEVLLLLPWDLAPELDWRSGVTRTRLDPAAVVDQATTMMSRIVRRGPAAILYLPAPLPPGFGDERTANAVGRQLEACAIQAGAQLLSADDFSLSSYFASGFPLNGHALGNLAHRAMEKLLAERREPAKLLITDLDHTLWHGVIAEDGLQGIAAAAEGVGYRHFVYQGLLLRLKDEGILLAAVSRNTPEVALSPLQGGNLLMAEDDFVAVVASYHAKSAQIRELTRQLNLGLDAVVFVDDNPVELEEVARQLPAVQCLAFPLKDSGLPEFLNALVKRCGHGMVTAEDRGRTELYRRRLEGMVPQEAQGADLEQFLKDLRMRLVVHDRSQGDRSRAVQLINKTNQFNLNGIRWKDEEVGEVLANGGRLLTAELGDRTGSHGEILACLISGDGTVQSLVLSCRVFQRRVEHVFCTWLARHGATPARMRFGATSRNEPFQMFLKDPSFGAPGEEGLVSWDAAGFARAHASVLSLFEIDAPVAAG